MLFGQAEGETLIDIIGGCTHRGVGKPNREIFNHSHAYKYSNAQMSKDDTRNLCPENSANFCLQMYR